MLYPRMQTVSRKGQMVIPADFRNHFEIKAGTMVLVVPDFIKRGIMITPIKAKDPIEAGYGLLAGGVSLTKALLKERKEEKKREEAGYGQSLRS